MNKRILLNLALVGLFGGSAALADEWRTPDEVRDKVRTEWQAPATSTPQEAATDTPAAASTTSPEVAPAVAPASSTSGAGEAPPTEAVPPTPVVEPTPVKKAIAKPAPVTDIKRRNESIVPYNQGVALYEAKKYDLALAKFQAASKIDPSYASPHVNMSMIYYFRRDWKNGLNELEQAMKVDPSDENPTLLLNAGLFAGNCHLFDKAMKYFNLALEYAPDDDVVLTDRGNLRLRMSQPQEALADYDRALKINPKNEQATENKDTIVSGKWSGGFSDVMLEGKKKAVPTPRTTQTPPIAHKPAPAAPRSKHR